MSKKEFCDRLAAAWSKEPDWSFMEAIANFTSYAGDMFNNGHYLTDEEFISKFEEYMEKASRRIRK